jgi:hypothetical protein
MVIPIFQRSVVASPVVAVTCQGQLLFLCTHRFLATRQSITMWGMLGLHSFFTNMTNMLQCYAMPAISCKDFRNTFHFFQSWSWQPVLLQAGIWPTLSCLQHFTTASYCFNCFEISLCFTHHRVKTKSRVDEVGPEDCLTWEFHRTRCRVLQLCAVLWLRVAWNHWQIHWHSCGFTGMVGLVASSHADLRFQILQQLSINFN